MVNLLEHLNSYKLDLSTCKALLDNPTISRSWGQRVITVNKYINGIHYKGSVPLDVFARKIMRFAHNATSLTLEQRLLGLAAAKIIAGYYQRPLPISWSSPFSWCLNKIQEMLFDSPRRFFVPTPKSALCYTEFRMFTKDTFRAAFQKDISTQAQKNSFNGEAWDHPDLTVPVLDLNGTLPVSEKQMYDAYKASSEWLPYIL
jgi:hypothetical protein